MGQVRLHNQMIDYINRGDSLKHMCLYDYVSKVYKTKYSPKEMKEDKMKRDNNTSTKRREDRIPFTKDHPQYDTHWQKVRLDSSAMVPTLSKLPPSINQNRERHQKCILLLFKPFTCLEDLYTIDLDETYSEFLE